MKGNHIQEMGLYKAFTKRWALFCAGKKFTDEDLIYRNQILTDEDFRQIKTDRASIRFCSVFYSNLSGLCVEKGGDFTGNGWDTCSFFQFACAKTVFTMEIYHDCIFGSASFYKYRITECFVKDCNYTNSLFREGEIRKSKFEKCIFRSAVFQDVTIKETVFSDCIFEEFQAEGVVCSDVIFENCRFCGCKMPKWEGCTFQNCILNC